MAILNSEIESQLTKEGASLVGFADISSLPATIRGSMKSAISIAASLNASIINEISDGPTQRYYEEYKRANEFLTRLCISTVNYLNSCGNRAVAIKPTVEIGELYKKTLTTSLPHKTVATRSGLGWIGKSALLITERYVAAVRLASILTDAQFRTGNPLDSSRCGDCMKCVVHCPAKAISGRNWKIGLEREFIYDALACYSTAISLSRKIEVRSTIICGICINVCPWTQEYISRELINMNKRSELKQMNNP